MAKKNNQPKQVSFDEVLAALLDDTQIFPASYLYEFTDLEDVELQSLETVWPQVNVSRRIALMEDLEELSDTDLMMWFNDVARFAVDDSEPQVRRIAVRMLWEASDADMAEKLIQMMQADPDASVRAAAASTLGKYVYEGELEEIPEKILHKVEDALLQVINSDDDIEVRRRALEAMGFSGREEVPQLIRKAYRDGNQKWLVSALYAMGRSADTNAWSADVMRMINHPQPEVQLEAVRAAGELEIEAARDPLLRILQNEKADEDVRSETVWALSKIGGEDVRETLELMLDETEDEEEAEFLENALDNLSFTEDMGLFGMFDFSNMSEEDKENYKALTGVDAEDDGGEDYFEDSSDDGDADEDESAYNKGDIETGPTGKTEASRDSKSKKKKHRHH